MFLGIDEKYETLSIHGYLEAPTCYRQEYSSAAFSWSQMKFVIVMCMMTEIKDLEGVQKRCPP